VIGVLGLIIALLAAGLARRSAGAAKSSADAAERSARAAERAVDLQASALRDQWIDRLASALAHPDTVPNLIHTLPAPLGPEWRELVVAAWRRNSAMSPEQVAELLDRVEGLIEEWMDEDPAWA
jgi:hypothetical protein